MCAFTFGFNVLVVALRVVTMALTSGIQLVVLNAEVLPVVVLPVTTVAVVF